jgi:hypothetical protein
MTDTITIVPEHTLASDAGVEQWTADELRPHLARVICSLLADPNVLFAPEFVAGLVMRIVSEFDGVPMQEFSDLQGGKQATDEWPTIALHRVSN